jgi:hypothetical protein
MSSYALSLALAATLVVEGACAQEPYPSHLHDCRGASFVQVTGVGGLPPAVRSVLLKEGQVADRGQQYQDTDVVSPPYLPLRRLALGAVSDHFVAILIERAPLPTQIWWFERKEDAWTGIPVEADPPYFEDLDTESLNRLLYMVCRGYSQPDPPAVRSVSSVVTGKGDMVLTVRSASTSVAFELRRSSGGRGVPEYREVRYLSTDRVLSHEERERLRSRLDKILPELKQDDSNRPIVAAYLQALQTSSKR